MLRGHDADILPQACTLQIFVDGVGRRMKPGGVFFVVDAFRRPGVRNAFVAVVSQRHFRGCAPQCDPEHPRHFQTDRAACCIPERQLLELQPGTATSAEGAETHGWLLVNAGEFAVLHGPLLPVGVRHVDGPHPSRAAALYRPHALVSVPCHLSHWPPACLAHIFQHPATALVTEPPPARELQHFTDHMRSEVPAHSRNGLLCSSAH